MSLRFLLFPFAMIYSIIISIRNACYNIGIFKSTSFDISIISVGNLSTGGTGKTPHIEYLIKLLQNEFKLATLSRGYGRKTKGYLNVNIKDKSELVGDEPKQIAFKYPNIKVAVCEDRINGIAQIRTEQPDTNLILLDDAFQHRKVKPGISILLSDYSKLFFNDYLLPMGNLRESRYGYRRADTIIITKCPDGLSEVKKQSIINKIKPLHHQNIYFSTLKYQKSYHLFTKESIDINNSDIILLTGIANNKSIKDYLSLHTHIAKTIAYQDHHAFLETDIEHIKTIFSSILSENKLIITTEKDGMRLLSHEEKLKDYPIYCLPISVNFDTDDFDKNILKLLKK